MSAFNISDLTDWEKGQFFRQTGPELDKLTMALCKDDRANGKTIPGWLLKEELAAFQRDRRRAA